MPNIYTLFNVGKIIAGPNSIESIAVEVAEFCVKTVLIITDQGVYNAGLIERPKILLESAGFNVVLINTTPPEPETGQVSAILEEVRRLDIELVIGIGGGSSMDVAKLIAVLLANEMTVKNLLDKFPIANRGLPSIMIPTTAGTGAEVTPNAILLSPEDELKIGIVSSNLMANCVILDPVLTVKLPPAITASTGIDALTHAIECYTSKKANPISDTFAIKAVGLISRSIRRVFKDGGDLDARLDMLLGAMFGGMCIATSSTTAVHALAYPLGGKYRIPHGLSNAILLPYVMKFNQDAVESRLKDLADAMGLPVNGLSNEQAGDLMIEQLFILISDLNISLTLRDKGVSEADLDFLTDAAAQVTRLLDNNPKKMTKDDIRNIYRKLL